MYDYFVAALKCPNCGSTSPADSSTNMQTHVRDDAAGIQIAVGFRFAVLEVRDQDIASSGYLATGRVSEDGSKHLLELWQCPVCAHENWARIVIKDAQLLAIEAVILDHKTLENTQFISDNCYILASRLSGIPAQDLMEGKVNPVNVLFERLR